MERFFRVLLYLILGLVVVTLGLVVLVPLLLYFMVFGKKRITFSRAAQGFQTKPPESGYGQATNTEHQEYDIDASFSVVDEKPEHNHAQIGTHNESN